MDKCNVCHAQYNTNCDWNQGRCPHRKSMINLNKQLNLNRHVQLFIIKGTIRTIAGTSLCLTGNTLLIAAGVALIIGELINIIEELV